VEVWRGRTAPSAPAAQAALTWDEWCARLRRIEHRRESVHFSERELARLSFMRWLYQRGCLAPVQSDNV
jgi:hypothetical protein